MTLYKFNGPLQGCDRILILYIAPTSFADDFMPESFDPAQFVE